MRPGGTTAPDAASAAGIESTAKAMSVAMIVVADYVLPDRRSPRPARRGRL